MSEEIKCCETCKYYDVDFYEDDESWDDYCVYTCTKTGEEVNPGQAACEKYRKYIPKPYVEQSYKCDTCDRLGACISNGNALNITMMLDTRQHYLPSICGCPKGAYE